MIVYQSTKDQFLDDAFRKDIHEVIRNAYMTRTGRRVSPAELAAWRESLMYMAKVLNDDAIPGNSGIAVEYTIPQATKRIDFIVSGHGDDRTANVIIVELKQWTHAQRTEKDGIVVTRLSGRDQEVSHPSYQAWSYAVLLQGFNEAVYDGGLAVQPCAYLHNYAPDAELTHPYYEHYLDRAPVFLKGDEERNRLREFIKQHVKYGDDAQAVYQIENGRIRPSKMLVDSLVGMMKGKQEFVLIDDQKVVYENALSIAKRASDTAKTVAIIEGGPGTGKSVIAINLLVALSKLGLVCKYVSKNAAPRSVFESKLTGELRKTAISNLFSGSGVFTDTEANAFDVLIVDEAHRLNEKSGLYANLGENQIKEIIASAKSAVFFLDEDQRVTLKDIGRKAEIEKWATEFGADVSTLQLVSQFRCNGSDGYLVWLDSVLGIRETANPTFDVEQFDLRIVDSPQNLRELIIEKNREANKARLVAGYCWNWVSKKKPREYDVVIPEHDFRMRWNLTKDGPLWIVAPNSVEEIGCIHTCQGLEVDYIGVVVGPDLVVRDGQVVSRPEKRARMDKSLSGLGRLEPETARVQADRIIKNTYKTLMTRGLKGCFVYFTDSETAAFFKSRLIARKPESRAAHEEPRAETGDVVPFKRAPRRDVRPYVDAVPLIDLKFAAGTFSKPQFDSSDHDEWAVLPDLFRPQRDLFVAQVVGESMNRRIPNGGWCLFRLNPAGTRQGKVVVAELRNAHDPESGGAYTVKVYRSEKVAGADGSWRHLQIRLEPDSTQTGFQPLVFEPEDGGSVRIVAELVAVL